MVAGKLTLEEKQKLVEAIHHAEHGTTSELRVHFSYAEKEENTLAAAKAHFAALGMQQTTERNGMLLYINPKLRKFSVFGDKGIHEKVKQEFWDQLSHDLTGAIREKSLVGGVVHAVGIMGKAMHAHFPVTNKHPNELPDDITESE